MTKFADDEVEEKEENEGGELKGYERKLRLRKKYHLVLVIGNYVYRKKK